MRRADTPRIDPPEPESLRGDVQFDSGVCALFAIDSSKIRQVQHTRLVSCQAPQLALISTLELQKNADGSSAVCLDRDRRRTAGSPASE